MADGNVMTAQMRDRAGKGAARATRRRGRLFRGRRPRPASRPRPARGHPAAARRPSSQGPPAGASPSWAAAAAVPRIFRAPSRSVFFCHLI